MIIEQGQSLEMTWPVENLKRRGHFSLDQESFLSLSQGGVEIDRLTAKVGLDILEEGPEWLLHAYISDTSFLPLGDIDYTVAIRTEDGESVLEDAGVITVLASTQPEPRKSVYPWDLIKPSSEHVDRETRYQRMTICRACPRFHRGVCGECFCVMRFKTLLADASCPLGRWEAVNA